MNLVFFVAFTLWSIASISKCSGKYVINNSPDLFPIQNLGKISATCESNQTVSECDENVELTIDGDSNTYWRGSSLINGNEFQEVNLTINFDQAIHIAKFSIEFVGSKHAPALWSLEKSTDYGKTWSVWHFITNDPYNCELLGIESTSDGTSTADNSTCLMQPYVVNQPITIDLMKNHQLTTNKVKSDTLVEWTRATSVRLHFYGLKVNLKHFPLLKKPNITETYFYAVKNIEILGYCESNGHYNKEPTALGYLCEHNTEGVCCSQCKPGFRQKKWLPHTKEQPFQCNPCNCYGHSDRCIYDEEIEKKRMSLNIHGEYEGGGVCQDCQHNTTGINCNECKAGYYRPYGKFMNDTDVCQPCDCDAFFFNGNCKEETGKCECKLGYRGPHCASCLVGYVGYPNCKPCSADGTDLNESPSNVCSCKPNFAGTHCDECKYSDSKYPNCNEIDSKEKRFLFAFSCLFLITLPQVEQKDLTDCEKILEIARR